MRCHRDHTLLSVQYTSIYTEGILIITSYWVYQEVMPYLEDLLQEQIDSSIYRYLHR